MLNILNIIYQRFKPVCRTTAHTEAINVHNINIHNSVSEQTRDSHWIWNSSGNTGQSEFIINIL